MLSLLAVALAVFYSCVYLHRRDRVRAAQDLRKRSARLQAGRGWRRHPLAQRALKALGFVDKKKLT